MWYFPSYPVYLYYFWDCWVFNAIITLVNVKICHYYVSVSGHVFCCETASLQLTLEDISRTKVQKKMMMVERDRQTEEGGCMRSEAHVIGKEMGYG